jgi:hypothetical protein
MSPHELEPMPDEARRAFDHAYCAMLARRYPGTTWAPTSPDAPSDGQPVTEPEAQA